MGLIVWLHVVVLEHLLKLSRCVYETHWRLLNTVPPCLITLTIMRSFSPLALDVDFHTYSMPATTYVAQQRVLTELDLTHINICLLFTTWTPYHDPI